MKKYIDILIFIIVIGIIFYFCVNLFNITFNLRADKSTPLCDMAQLGFSGARVYGSLKALNPVAFLAALIRQSFWPFIHSCLLSVAFLFGGLSFNTATVVSNISYFFVMVLLFIAGKQVSNSSLAGILAVFLGLTSPMYMIYSSLIMLEIFGVLFILMTFCVYFKSLEDNNIKYLNITAVLLVITFFTKYNYGVLLAITVFLAEYYRSDKSYRIKLKNIFLSKIKIENIRKPWNIFIILFSLLIITVLIDSRHFPGNIKNQLYLFFLMGVIRFLWLRKKGRTNMAVIRENLRMHNLLQITSIPIIIWFLIPFNNKFDGFIKFFITYSAKAASLIDFNNLLFFVNVIKNNYTQTNLVFFIMIILFAVSFFNSKTTDVKIRILQFFFIMHFLVNTLHHNKIDRYIFTALPALWIVSSVCFTGLINKLKPIKNSLLLQWMIVLAVIVLLLTGFKDVYGFLKNNYTNNFADNEISLIASDIGERTKDSKCIRVIGDFIQLSSGLISWNVFIKHGLQMPKIFFNRLPKDNAKKNCAESVVSIELGKNSRYFNDDYRLCHNNISLSDYVKSNQRYKLDSKDDFPGQDIAVSFYTRY